MPVPRCTVVCLAGLGLRHVAASFPALNHRQRVPCSLRAVPSPSYMCFRSVFQTLSCQSSSVERLSPPTFCLCPSCCYRLRKCLTPSLLCLLFALFQCFLSLSSHRSLAPTSCVPVSRRLRCFLVYTGLSLICSSLALAADQVCFRPSRDASPPFSLLGKGRPCHTGALCS